MPETNSILHYFQISPHPKIWLIQIAFIFFITICADFISSWILRNARKAASKKSPVWSDAAFWAAIIPLRWFIWILGISISLRLMQAVHPHEFFKYIPIIHKTSIILLIALFASRFIRRISKNLQDPEHNKNPVDSTTVKAFSRLLQFAILIIATLISLETFGYSISGVLAMGGVGGIAIGFAAKDMLANFFGGMMIYLDKPFREGDWIRSPDRQIEGVVEEIGWRLTIIRTFDQRPLYVPNSMFTSIAVENPSRMLNRQLMTSIGVRYDDGDKVKVICDDIRHMLSNHPDIDQNQVIIVHFNEYADSSLNILLWCYTKTTKWVEFHRVKENVFLQIMDIVNAHKAEFAFPTQTLSIPQMENILKNKIFADNTADNAK